MTYYKVLIKGFVGWHSQCSKYQVYYKCNKWVYPTIPKSKLFVFNDLQAAINFKNELVGCMLRPLGMIQIFKCEVQKPAKIQSIARDTQDIEDFWRKKAYRKKLDDYLCTEPLPNTVICDAVKIGKKV